jgi:hypothetical protein
VFRPVELWRRKRAELSAARRNVGSLFRTNDAQVSNPGLTYSSTVKFFGSFYPVSICWKFLLYPRDQLIIGRTGDDAVKLRAVVVNEADVFDYQVVDSPILSDANGQSDRVNNY